MNGRNQGRAVITRAEYEALVERIEDIEDVLELRAAEARGITPDALPASLVKRLIEGEHPVRIWREHRKITLSELARRSDVPVSYLSEIETGKKPGSVAALKEVATALGLGLDDVVKVAIGAEKRAVGMRDRPQAGLKRRRK